MSIRPFELERFFARHEFSARYLLGSSDPESMEVGDLLNLEPGSEASLRRLWLGYTESQGDPELRLEIARTYQTLRPEDLLVFSGAEEPIYAFMQVALSPGDHLVVHCPGYQSHFEVARSLGAEVTLWQSEPSKGWALDPDDLPRLVKPSTRALLVNLPHNPTGYLMEENSFRRVVDFAAKHGLWLFSDEVYRGLEQDRSRRLPCAADLYERAVSLGCLSKSYGLAGLRLGWIGTHDRALMQKLAAFKDYTTICNSAPSEFLGRIAVRHTEALWERSRSLLAQNLDQVEAFMARHQDTFRWTRPQAGSTAFPGFRKGSAQRFCDRLVAETGVLLVPSTLFQCGDTHLRLGYGRKNLPEALEKLESWLG